MAEHSHEIVTHLYHVKLPYHMDGQMLEVEPGVSKAGNGTDQLRGLIKDYSEEEMRRIFAGAVVLLEKYPHRTLSEALETAMVWERG
jgi:hypothetical protein